MKFPKIFFCTVLAISNFCFSQENSSKRVMNPENSIMENAEDSGNHNTLLAAVKAADLELLLNETGPFTVFAPSDVAFEKLDTATKDSLLNPENKKKLHSILTYHIVAGNLSASKILKAMCRGRGKATFITVQGDLLTATMKGLDIVLSDSKGNTAMITTADANQCNGIIHVIDSVIMPSKM